MTLTEKVYVPVKEHPDVSFSAIINLFIYCIRCISTVQT